MLDCLAVALLVASQDTGRVTPMGQQLASTRTIACTERVRVALPSDCYIERGVMKNVGIRSSYYVHGTTESDGPRIFYVPSDNAIGALTAPTHLEGFSKSSWNELKSSWVQSLDIEIDDRWAVSVLTYLQGLVYGDFWFDVSLGLPTYVDIREDNGTTRCLLRFNAPTILFLRVGSKESDIDVVDIANSFTFESEIVIDSRSIRSISRDRIGLPVYHHNGFFVVAAKPLQQPGFLVDFDGFKTPSRVDSRLPFRYLQRTMDGRCQLVRHDATDDRPYDEGPYVVEATLDVFPEWVRLRTPSDSLTIAWHDAPDLFYRGEYMDMFGARFPRNAVIFNYRQFGETKPRVAALASYTGIGMGWIPTPLLPGEYSFTLDISERELSPRTRVRPDRVPLRVEEGDSKYNTQNLLDLMREGTEIATRQRRIPRRTAVEIAREVDKHWTALDWGDWRTRWAKREWAPWAEYWGRSDPFELAHLCWESSFAAVHLGHGDLDWYPHRVTDVWLPQVCAPAQRFVGLDSGPNSTVARLGLPSMFAARWMIHSTDHKLCESLHDRAEIEDIVSFLRNPQAISTGFRPDARLERLVGIADAASLLYFELLRASCPEFSSSEFVPLKLPNGIASAVHEDDLVSYFPWMSWLACPEIANLLCALRPDLIPSILGKFDAPQSTRWFAVRFGAESESPWTYTYFPQCIYGFHDALYSFSLCCRLRPPAARLDTDSNERLSIYSLIMSSRTLR